MLLDALMAASEHLLITYTGNDERTNLERPPAVPVGELLDAVDASARGVAGDARAQVLVRHPLQPIDPRNFTAAEIVGGRRWSFDRAALGGARALVGPRGARPPFLERPLPDAPEPALALDDLVAFVAHPVRAFLRRRLRVSLFEEAEEIADSLPIELDALERYGVGQRLLDSVLAGIDGNAAIRAEIARGTLPPGVLGWPVVKSLWQEVEAIAARARQLAPAAFETPDPIDVRLELPDGRLLNGTVPLAQEDLILEAAFSRLAPRHRLAAWVRLIAATAAEPDRPLSAATIGRAASSRDEAVGTLARIPALGADPAERAATASAALATIVDLHDRGMREPLPLPCATAAAYAAAARRAPNPLNPARPKLE
jgi:exodeoxyribonuclease V gamma subunit